MDHKFCLFWFALLSGISGSRAASRILLPTWTAGKCLDGTPGGFYFQESSAFSSDKWVFSLEGGGECVTAPDCQARAKTDLGSSKGWPPTIGLGQLQSPDRKQNAVMYDWNMVFIQYCSGDVWGGQVTQPTNDTFGLYFSGHLVVEAVIDYLTAPNCTLSRTPLSKASVVVFSGDSAGGIGAFINLDYVHDRLPGVRVIGAPIAGFYFPSYPYTGPDAGPIDVPFTVESWPIYYKLYKMFVPVRCAAANPDTPWVCALGNTSYATLASPVFIFESQTDKVTMGLHDGITVSPPFPNQQITAYVTQWAANMSQALTQLPHNGSPTRGLFNPACWMHTEFSSTQPLINGWSYVDVFNSWAFKHSPEIPYIVKDTCGLLCNPTCPQ